MAANLQIFTGLTMASTPACSFQASSTSSLSLSPSLSRRRRPLTTSLGSYSGRRMPANYQVSCGDQVRGQCSNTQLTITPTKTRGYKDGFNLINRRNMIGFIFGVSSLVLDSFQAEGAGLPPEEKPRLCDASCEKELENVCSYDPYTGQQFRDWIISGENDNNVPMVTTESGLQYKDIKVGQGPSPPVGFQVAANYVAMVPSGQIFDSSLEKGQLYIFRVGSDQVIKGLDEGILTMKVGGKRRLYIPGSLAFPKGLTSAPGRPRVAPSSPVVFDVSLEYVPGLEIEEEYEN